MEYDFEQLNNDEILDLLNTSRTDKVIQEQIYNGTIGIAVTILRQYKLDVDEYIGHTVLPLIKTCENYDIDRGAKFTTFYIWNLKSVLSSVTRKEFRKTGKDMANISLDKEGADGEGNELYEILPSNVDILKDLMKNEDVEVLYHIIEKLKPRQQIIIKRRLNGEDGKIIASDLGVSYQYIYKECDRIVEKLTVLFNEYLQFGM